MEVEAPERADAPEENGVTKGEEKGGQGGTSTGNREMRRRLSIHSDGFAWVKYGEKSLAPTGIIREYYKCRNWRTEKDGGSCCPARKVVDRPSSPHALRSPHSHPQQQPTQVPSLASAQFSSTSPHSPAIPHLTRVASPNATHTPARGSAGGNESATGVLLSQVRQHNHPPPERRPRRKTCKADEASSDVRELSASSSREEGAGAKGPQQGGSEPMSMEHDGQGQVSEGTKGAREDAAAGASGAAAQQQCEPQPGERSFWADLTGWISRVRLPDSTGRSVALPCAETSPPREAEAHAPITEQQPNSPLASLQAASVGPISPESQGGQTPWRKLPPTLVIPETVVEGQECSEEQAMVGRGDAAAGSGAAGMGTPSGERLHSALSLRSPLANFPPPGGRRTVATTPLQGRQGEMLVSPRLKLPRICTELGAKGARSQGSSAGASPGSFGAPGPSIAASAPTTPADALHMYAGTALRQPLPSSSRRPPVSPLSTAASHKDLLSAPLQPVRCAPASSSAPATPFTQTPAQPACGNPSFPKPPCSPGTLGTLLGTLGPISGGTPMKMPSCLKLDLSPPDHSHIGDDSMFASSTPKAHRAPPVSSQAAAHLQGQSTNNPLAQALLQMLGSDQDHNGAPLKQSSVPAALGRKYNGGVLGSANGGVGGSPCSPGTFCTTQQILNSPSVSRDRKDKKPSGAFRPELKPGRVGGGDQLLRSVLQVLAGSTAEASASFDAQAPPASSHGSPSIAQSSLPPLRRSSSSKPPPQSPQAAPGYGGFSAGRVGTTEVSESGGDSSTISTISIQLPQPRSATKLALLEQRHAKQEGRASRSGSGEVPNLMQELLVSMGEKRNVQALAELPAQAGLNAPDGSLLELLTKLQTSSKENAKVPASVLLQGGIPGAHDSDPNVGEEERKADPTEGLASAVLPLLQELRKRLVRQALEGLLTSSSGSPGAAALEDGSSLLTAVLGGGLAGSH